MAVFCDLPTRLDRDLSEQKDVALQADCRLHGALGNDPQRCDGKALVFRGRVILRQPARADDPESGNGNHR